MVDGITNPCMTLAGSSIKSSGPMLSLPFDDRNSEAWEFGWTNGVFGKVFGGSLWSGSLMTIFGPGRGHAPALASLNEPRSSDSDKCCWVSLLLGFNPTSSTARPIFNDYISHKDFMHQQAYPTFFMHRTHLSNGTNNIDFLYSRFESVKQVWTNRTSTKMLSNAAALS